MPAGNEGMEKLITVVNRLQDAFSSSGLPFGLDLPQIAVVGGQSAGKSSVLENFVGKDFLPRGSGIVTRRPLVLQLYTASEEYAEFLHIPNRRFTNFSEVRHEIETETDRETGTNKGISSRPINLRVYSPHVLNLTLVDLPGMTRVPVGDQPADIEVQIRNMVMEYIRKESTLILAVSPANSDLANSDAMKVAREVDQKGDRTIGVITKLDLMDEGTDAREILMGNLLPLKRGYIAVVNRSQKDIDGRKDISAAMEAEKTFFINHSSYRDIHDRCGTPYLQLVLNKELSRHIHKTLPEIRNSLRTKMLEVKRELMKLEDISSPDAMRKKLMELVREFAEEVETQIQGLNADIDVDRLGGGAKINRLFYNEFAVALAIEEIPENELKKKIAFAIKNIGGVRGGIFTPDMAFVATIVKIIETFEKPVQDCVVLVAEVLVDIMERSANIKIENSKLKDEILFYVKDHIQTCEDVAKKQLMTHVAAEKAFMNTRHEDFIVSQEDHVSHTSQDSPEFTQSLDSVKRKLDKQEKNIKRGWLNLHNTKKKFSSSTEYWFRISSEVLIWYKDQQEADDIGLVHLNQNIKYKTEEKGKNKFRIILYRTDGKNFFDQKTIELSCNDENEFENWISAFKTCGIYQETTDESKEELLDDLKKELAAEGTGAVETRRASQELRRNRKTTRDCTPSMVNPRMDSQTETIKTMVKSYLKIVGKTIRDLVPKYIMLLLVLDTQKFVTDRLLAQIMNENDVVTLMTDDSGAADRRAELDAIYKSSEEALKIINEAGSLVT